jgi:hypothetical protein
VNKRRRYLQKRRRAARKCLGYVEFSGPNVAVFVTDGPMATYQIHTLGSTVVEYETIGYWHAIDGKA